MTYHFNCYDCNLSISDKDVIIDEKNKVFCPYCDTQLSAKFNNEMEREEAIAKLREKAKAEKIEEEGEEQKELEEEIEEEEENDD